MALSSRSRYDRKTAYELLTTLELRFQNDNFHDFAPDQHCVTWGFLLNEYVIPLLLQTGRIDAAEAETLELIRRNRARRPTEEDAETWADIHELLLCYHSVHFARDGQIVYRGQAEDWPLVSTLLRGDPSPDELDRRLSRTFAFIEALCKHDQGMKARGEADDPDPFLELIAVAQHYGLPTHLLDFTTDIRTAAYFASNNAKEGGIGSILILHMAQYKKLQGPPGSPYGSQVTASAPNPRIARQHGLFIAGHDKLIFSDPRTDLLERYLFRHRTPLSPVGGYDRKTLLDEGSADPLSVIAKNAGDAPKRPSRQLSASFERYREYIHALVKNRFSELGDAEFAHTCAYALRSLLTEDSPWIDRRIAELFITIEVELAKRDDLAYWFKFATLPRMAFEDYLSSSVSLE